MKKERKTLSLELKDGDQAGAVVACFSTFDVVDKDRDVVLASAFTPGQEVPLTWSHDWSQIVGKGVIRVETDRAIFDGAFFLETQAGLEAYKTVKAMGSLQEYSWGFSVVDSSYETRDGKSVRIIKQAKVYEVSPVLVGAGENTRTLAIKSPDPEPRFKAADFATTFEQALTAEQLNEARWDIDRAWRISFNSILNDQNLDTTAKLSLIRVSGAQYIEALAGWSAQVLTVAPTAISEVMYYGLEDTDHKGQPFADHLETVLAAVKGMTDRASSLAELRRKEGRAISQSRLDRMATVRDQMRQMADELDAMMTEVNPPVKASIPLDYLERRLRASALSLASLR